MAAEAWLRRFLLAAAAATYSAAAVEMVLVEHYEEALQIAPFVMVGLGLIAVVWVWGSPSASSLRTLRWVGGLVVIGSLIGVGLHVNGNLEFAREVRIDASTGELLWAALSGRNPLLAPGMTGLAGILAAAATYRHPDLPRSQR